MPQDPVAGLALREGYEPGDIGRITELHGRYYASAWGTGAAFEIFVARALSDFVERYDPALDLLLTARLNGVVIGSAAVLGRTDEPGMAQLRFVIVDPAFQRMGAGTAMLGRAMHWAAAAGFGGLFLWTVDNLPWSRKMYEKAGFHVVERRPDSHYGVPWDELKMAIVLQD